MSDKIAAIRARHKRDVTYGDGWFSQAHNDRAFLLAEVERLTRERDEALAEVEKLCAENERQAQHIEVLKRKIDAEKSCACSYDQPGDVCAAHSPALAAARAENERLREERDALRKIILDADAEWWDKKIHPTDSDESYQNWRLIIFLPVPCNVADKGIESALDREVANERVRP